VVLLKEELKQIYITKQASDLLDQIDTSTPKYRLASNIIIAAIARKK